MNKLFNHVVFVSTMNLIKIPIIFLETLIDLHLFTWVRCKYLKVCTTQTRLKKLIEESVIWSPQYLYRTWPQYVLLLRKANCALC